jgi:hypothetical protein
MGENKADATTVFKEKYDIKFSETEAKRVNEFFDHQNDISGNLRYRMFNRIDTFKDATAEHTIIQGSRLRPTHIELVVREFELNSIPKDRWLDVDYGVSNYKKISRAEIADTNNDAYDTQNIIIMSISTIDGAKIDKRYEACVFNSDLDLVTDSIRFV